MSESKKRLLIISGGIVGFVILMIIILLIVNGLNKDKGYSSIEKKLLNATESYYANHKDLKPTEVNTTTTITDAELTSGGYIKNLSELTSKLTTEACSATIYVTYNKDTGNYRYTPILDCGESYKTETLASHIEKVEEKVYSDDGLYDMNGELVFRGENPNNFVDFSGNSWQIVKITNENVVLILNKVIEKVEWDDRYNNEKTTDCGINDYKVSRIRARLDWLYQNNKIVKSKDKDLLDAHNLYIGNRYETDYNNDGSTEKANYIENEYVGLLPMYDYINASTDEHCNSTGTPNCVNYNFIGALKTSWWTMTGNAENTYRTYSIERGDIASNYPSKSKGVRPVIYLVKDALYVGGTGTSSDPYTIK